MHISVRGVDIKRLQGQESGPTSADLRAQVVTARESQNERFAGSSVTCNAGMESKDLQTFCKLNSECQELLKRHFDAKGLSARSYDRILKVARTIADLHGHELLAIEHIAQALQYRQLDEEVK